MNEELELTSGQKKQQKTKENLIEQLNKNPIIQIACERVGIGRATFYRWRKEDEQFAEAVDSALNDGASLVNDLAESKLISAIKESNLSAIIFWLKNHHLKYATRVEVTANLKNVDQSLTPEQQAIVEQALKLANLTEPESGSESEQNEPDNRNSGEHPATGTPPEDIQGS